MRLRIAAAIFAIVLLGVQQTRAGVAYSYVTDQTSYSAAVGQTVTVNIFLQETLTGSSTSFINANQGMFSGGAGLNFSNVTGGTAAQVVNGGFTPNNATEPSGFTGPSTAVYNQGSGAAANNLEFVEGISTTAATNHTGVTTNANNQVLLGSIKITVGSGSTSFVLTSLNNDTINSSMSQLGQTNGNTVTVNGPSSTTHYDLDVTQTGLYTGANDASPYVFMVTAVVPEPSSILLTGLFAAGFVACTWRHWRWRGATTTQ